MRKKRNNGFIPKTAFKKGHISWLKGKKLTEATGKDHPFLGKKHSQESKRKMSIAHKGIPNLKNFKGGKPNCIDCNKQIGYLQKRCRLCYSITQKGKYSESMRRGGLRGAKTLSERKTTSIEKILYDYLVLKRILFERQKIINGKFLVDAYIPSLNLIIEADGKYWHTLDRVKKKDKAENAYLKKCGFNLIRLSEKEINNGNFIERLVF